MSATHPDLVVVIDHLAKPPFLAPSWDAWVAAIRLAASYPTVRAKVSGLDTAAGMGWSAAELRPARDVALQAFGPDRLMFGSDWPVCLLVSTYRDVVEAARELVSELSASERDRILGGTAIDVYRLAAAQSPPTAAAR